MFSKHLVAWKETQELPSEEFELTDDTLQADIKLHGKLILKPLIYLTAHSWDDLTAVTSLSLHLTP